MSCSACKARGKTWKGDDPVCAFPSSAKGVFDPAGKNWNCATMNGLRDMAEERSPAYSEDQYAAVIPIPGSCSFIVLCWYKHHGATDSAWVVDDETCRPMTLADALLVLGRT